MICEVRDLVSGETMWSQVEQMWSERGKCALFRNMILKGSNMNIIEINGKP